jgi:hypothetical protein
MYTQRIGGIDVAKNDDEVLRTLNRFAEGPDFVYQPMSVGITNSALEIYRIVVCNGPMTFDRVVAALLAMGYCRSHAAPDGSPRFDAVFMPA